MAYEWSKKARRYRNQTSGRFVAKATIMKWRNTARGVLEQEATALAHRVAAGDMTVQFWERGMQDVVRRSMTTEFLLGRGGVNAWTAGDRAALDRLVRAQFEYLREFSYDLAAGKLSERQIAARGRMYARAGNTSYNLASGRAWDVDLPGMPGTDCLGMSNCACQWSIRTETTGRGKNRKRLVIATWELGASEHCPVCLGHAADWGRVEFELPLD